MMLARRLAALPLPLVLLAPAGAWAEEAVSGFSHTFELTLVSDYVFRGISNSNEEAAVQPAYTLTYATKGGMEWYAGVWGSTLDQEAAVDHEVDFWAGAAWSSSLADFSAALTWYTYPGSPEGSDLAYGEAQITAARALGEVATLSGEFNYSPDYYAGTGDAYYTRIGLTSGDDVLPGGLVLEGHVGKQLFDDNTAFGAPDYIDGGVRLSRTFSWLTAGVEWTTTDMSQADCFGGLSICEDRVFATLTAAVSP